MKRRVSAVMAFVVVAATLLAACSGISTQVSSPLPPTAAPTPTPKMETVAVSLPALDSPQMLEFQDAFRKAFGDQYDVQVVGAEGSAATQASQVENFTALKAKFMFVMAVEPASPAPKLVAARQAGVRVLLAGGDPGDANAYDAVMKPDPFLAGACAALMAKKWLALTDPEAASVDTVVFESTLTPEAAARSQGLKLISEPYLKNAAGAYVDATGAAISDASGTYLSGKSDADRVPNPAYHSAIKIVKTVQADTSEAAQAAMLDVLATPRVEPAYTRVVLTYASDIAMGASKAIMDESAKGIGKSGVYYLPRVGVFSVGLEGAEGPAIVESSKDHSAFRGTIRINANSIERTIEYAKKMLNGGPYPKIIGDAFDMVTATKEGQLMARPVGDGSAVVVPPNSTPRPLVLPSQ